MSQKSKIKAIFQDLISETRKRIENCRNRGSIDWDNFEVWRTACLDAIEVTFGSNHRNLIEFQGIRFTAEPNSMPIQSLIAHIVGLQIALEKLIGMFYTIEVWLPEDEPQLPPAPFQPITFIAHGGSNQSQLNKLKEFLLALGAVPVVVEEQPSLGLSILDKVRYYIAYCNSGIALITAEDRLQGSNEVRGRPNVDHEIGILMESANIGGRLIILKEQGVTLPSNYRELVWTEFSGDNLDSALTQIVKEFRAFGFFS